jgi:hypothetical protein
MNYLLRRFGYSRSAEAGGEGIAGKKRYQVNEIVVSVGDGRKPSPSRRSKVVDVPKGDELRNIPRLEVGGFEKSYQMKFHRLRMVVSR